MSEVAARRRGALSVEFTGLVIRPGGPPLNFGALGCTADTVPIRGNVKNVLAMPGFMDGLRKED